MKLQHLKNYMFMLKTFRNGFELIQTLRGGAETHTAIVRDGTRIVHPDRQGGLAGTISELWIQQCYTAGGFYQPRGGDVIIDVGAHVGLFSIWIARQQPTCRVVALEPFQANFKCLQSNIESAGLTTFETFQLAIGPGYGWGQMRKCTGRSIDHRITVTRSPDNDAVPTVPLEALPVLAKTERIAFLKMDVEGAEHEAFANVEPDTLRRFERIALEYHDNLVPGTLELVTKKLCQTHKVSVQPTANRGYGILLATLR